MRENFGRVPHGDYTRLWCSFSIDSEGCLQLAESTCWPQITTSVCRLDQIDGSRQGLAGLPPKSERIKLSLRPRCLRLIMRKWCQVFCYRLHSATVRRVLSGSLPNCLGCCAGTGTRTVIQSKGQATHKLRSANEAVARVTAIEQILQLIIVSLHTQQFTVLG